MAEGTHPVSRKIRSCRSFGSGPQSRVTSAWAASMSSFLLAIAPLLHRHVTAKRRASQCRLARSVSMTSGLSDARRKDTSHNYFYLIQRTFRWLSRFVQLPRLHVWRGSGMLDGVCCDDAGVLSHGKEDPVYRHGELNTRLYSTKE